MGNWGLIATSVTNELVVVRVKRQGEKTIGTEGLPTAIFANRQRGGAAAVVEDEGLAAVLEVGLY